MPRGATYANNAANRSSGRAGMAMGSAVQSSSRSSGGSYASSSSRSYVDNSQNRSLGRVGLSLGSQPVSSSSPSRKTYVDNSQNQALGRVGMSYGSHPSSSSSPSAKTYVDNSQNRSLGRVGMAFGSQSVSSSSTSPKTYVDNSQNRSLGRVGMAFGSQPVLRSSTSPKTYVDNSQNRSMGRVGMAFGSQPVSSRSLSRQPVGKIPQGTKKGCYVDNPYNRSIGRVGMKYGSVTAPVFQRKLASTSKQEKLYVDNAANRRLGRVGKPIGSVPASLESKGDYMKKACQHLQQNEFDEEFEHPLPRDQYNQNGEDSYHQEEEVYQDRITELMKRLEAWETKSQKESCAEDESENYSGYVIQYEDITLGEKIGHGGFGDVFHAKWNDRDVAVKKLRVQRVSRKRLSQFTNEVILFSKLKHANIIGFFGASMITPNICMVMELMQGSLYDMIHIEEKQFESEVKIEILRDIASGLAYLHDDIKMAHCDMKSANILLTVDQENDSIIVKITDFGLSMLKQDTDVTTSSDVRNARDIGTPRYSAPEILRGQFLDIKAFMKADIYAFGLIMHEVFSEEVPFEDLNIHQLHNLVGEGTHTLDFDIFIEEIDESLINIMRACWERNPKRRPTADEICNQLLL